MRGNGPAGTRLRYGPDGKPKLIKTDGAQWSDEAEAKFFDVLAATCNVRLAAKAAGFTTATAYYQRRRRADFADKWQVSLTQGYARIEMAMVEAAARSMEGLTLDADHPVPKMTVDQAMNLLKLHGPEVRGEGRGRPGRFARRKSFDEVRASVIRKIEAIKAARGMDGPSGEAGMAATD